MIDFLSVFPVSLNTYRYAGADQWQLEGVQPSGIRSGGIYGLWSHVDHDDHGPMGPFYYVSCELAKFSFEEAM